MSALGLALALISTLPTQAAPGDVEARKLFLEAELARDADQFETCAEKLGAVVDALGRRPLRVLALQAECQLYGHQHRRALDAANAYLASDPPTDTHEYRRITSWRAIAQQELTRVAEEDARREQQRLEREREQERERVEQRRRIKAERLAAAVRARRDRQAEFKANVDAAAYEVAEAEGALAELEGTADALRGSAVVNTALGGAQLIGAVLCGAVFIASGAALLAAVTGNLPEPLQSSVEDNGTYAAALIIPGVLGLLFGGLGAGFLAWFGGGTILDAIDASSQAGEADALIDDQRRVVSDAQLRLYAAERELREDAE